MICIGHVTTQTDQTSVQQRLQRTPSSPASSQTTFYICTKAPEGETYLFSKISSVRCSSSLLLFSLLLIISRMVTARLRSLRSFSIFS